jgi:hypothetical protein
MDIFSLCWQELSSTTIYRCWRLSGLLGHDKWTVLNEPAPLETLKEAIRSLGPTEDLDQVAMQWLNTEGTLPEEALLSSEADIVRMVEECNMSTDNEQSDSDFLSNGED